MNADAFEPPRQIVFDDLVSALGFLRIESARISRCARGSLANNSWDQHFASLGRKALLERRGRLGWERISDAGQRHGCATT